MPSIGISHSWLPLAQVKLGQDVVGALAAAAAAVAKYNENWGYTDDKGPAEHKVGVLPGPLWGIFSWVAVKTCQAPRDSNTQQDEQQPSAAHVAAL